MAYFIFSSAWLDALGGHVVTEVGRYAIAQSGHSFPDSSHTLCCGQKAGSRLMLFVVARV